MSLPYTHNSARISPRQFATVKHRFKNVARVGRQTPKPDLFFRPQKNPRSEPVWLNQALHECHLIDTDREKEPYKFSQSLFAQFSPPAEIIAPRPVPIGDTPLVSLDIPRPSSRNGPHRTRIQCFEQHCVRDEPGYSAVPV